MSDSAQCELCDKNRGEFSCESCDMDNLCAACDADLHRNAKQASHRRKISATGEYVQLTAMASGVPASSPSSTASASADSLAASPTGSDGGSRRGGLGLQTGSLRNNMPRPSINLLAPRPPPHSLLGAIHEHGGAAPSKIKNRASVTLAFQVMKGEQVTPEAVGVPPSDEPFVKMCDICSSAPAAQYCPQCQRFSCSECDHTTHKSSAMKGHARMPYPPVFNKTPSGPTSPISEASTDEEQSASGAPQLSVAVESPSNAISISAPSPLARSSISPALAALAAQPRAGLTLGAPGGGRNTRAMSVMAPVSAKPLIQLPIRTGGASASGAVSASAGTAATPAPTCDICEDSAASVWCAECKMHLCVSNNCDQELHTPAKTKWHVRNPLGEAIRPFGEAAATTTTPAATAVTLPTTTTADSAISAAASTLSTPAAVSIAASSLLTPQMNRPRASSVMLKSPPLAQPPRASVASSAAGMLNLPSSVLPSSNTSSAHASPDGTARTARGSRLCEICEVHPAALYCAACPMYMCTLGGCDAQLHAPAKLAHHFRAPMPKAKCSICEEQEGDVWCFDCAKHYCSTSHCDRDYHQPAKNAAHRRENVRALHAVDSAQTTTTAATVEEPKMNIVVTPEETTPPTPAAAVPVSLPAAAATTTTNPTTPPFAAVVAPEPAAVVVAPVVAPAVAPAPAPRVFPQGAAAPAKPAAVVAPPAAVAPVAASPAPVAAAPVVAAAPKKDGGAFSSLLSQLVPSTAPVAAPKSNIFIVCDSCDVALAALVCEACRAEESVVVEQFFCVACDKRRHATASKRESHRRRAILKTDTQRPVTVDPLVKAAASVALAIPDIASVLAQSPNHSPQSSPPMSRKTSPRRGSGTNTAVAAIVPSPLVAVTAPVVLNQTASAATNARGSFSSPAVSVVKSLPECDRCSKAKASIFCEDCELNLDAACFAELHKSSAAKLHPKKNLVEQGSAAAAPPAAIVPIQAPPSLLSLNLAEPPPKPVVVPVVVAAPTPAPAVVPVVVAAAGPPAAEPKKTVTKPAAKPTTVPRPASAVPTKAVEESKSASPVLAPATTSPPKAAVPVVKPKPKVPVQAKPAVVAAASDTAKPAAVAESKENGSDAAPVVAAKPKPAAKPAVKPAAKKPAASPAATPAASPTNAASSSAGVAPVPAAAAAPAAEPVVASQPKPAVSVTSEPLPPIVVAAAPAAVVAPAAAAVPAPRSKSPAIPKLNLATPALAALANAAPLHPSALLPAPPMSSRSDTSADSSSSSSSSDDESARKKRSGNSKKKIGDAAKPATATATAAGAPTAHSAHHHHHGKSDDFAVDDLALLTARSAALAKQKKAEAKAEAKAKVRAIVEAKHAAEKAPANATAAAATAPVDPASKLASLEKSLQSRVATLEHSLQESVQLKSARIHSARTEAIIQSLKSTGVLASSAAPVVVAPPSSGSDVSDTPEAMAAIRMELFNARTQLAQFQQLAHALSFQLQFGAAAGAGGAGGPHMHHPMAAAGGMGTMWPFMMNMAAASPTHATASSSPLAAAGPLPAKLSMLSSLPAPFQKELQELVASTVQATLAASPSHGARALQSSARSEEEFDPYAASRLRAKYTTINDSVYETSKAEQKVAERASESAPELSRPATAYPASSSMLSHHSGTSTPIKATRLSSAPSSGGPGLTPAQLQAREAARAKMGATAPVVPLAFESSPTPASVSLSALPMPSNKKMIVPRGARSSNQSSEEESGRLGTSETDTDRSSLQDAETAAASKRRLAPLVSRPASASSLRSALKGSRPASASRKSLHARDDDSSTADDNDAVVFLAPSQRNGAPAIKKGSRSKAPSTADWSEEDSDQEQFEAELAAADDGDEAHQAGSVSSATSSLIARYREEALGAMRGTPSSRKSPQQHQSPARLKPIHSSLPSQQHHQQQQQFHQQKQQQQQQQQQHEASASPVGHSRSVSSDRRRAREEKRHQSLEAQLQLERAYRAEEAARNVTLRAALRSLQYEKEEAVSAVQAAQWVSRQAEDDAREDAEVQRRAQLSHAQIDQARWDSALLFNQSQSQQPPPALPTARTLSKLMQAQLYASTQPAREAQLLAHRRSASVVHSSGPPSPMDDYSAGHYRSPPMVMRSHDLGGAAEESSVNAYYQQQAAAQQHQAHYLAQLHFSPLQHQSSHHLHQQQQHHSQQQAHQKHRGHLSHSASAGSLQAILMRSGSPGRAGSPLQQSGAQRTMERVYSAATLPVYRPTVKSPKPVQGGWM